MRIHNFYSKNLKWIWWMFEKFAILLFGYLDAQKLFAQLNILESPTELEKVCSLFFKNLSSVIDKCRFLILTFKVIKMKIRLNSSVIQSEAKSKNEYLRWGGASGEKVERSQIIPVVHESPWRNRSWRVSESRPGWQCRPCRPPDAAPRTPSPVTPISCSIY